MKTLRYHSYWVQVPLIHLKKSDFFFFTIPVSCLWPLRVFFALDWGICTHYVRLNKKILALQLASCFFFFLVLKEHNLQVISIFIGISKMSHLNYGRRRCLVSSKPKPIFIHEKLSTYKGISQSLDSNYNIGPNNFNIFNNINPNNFNIFYKLS